MIIFHEGLPRSGKSYETVVRRVIDALKKGRTVDAYIEGLDHEKIAALVGIELSECQRLLVVLTAEQVPEVYKYARDNSLVVIDEVQDFFGVKAKLSPDMTSFVTQHGHRGIDVVLMGQDFKDANVLWRRRIEIKCQFLKLSGVGAENRYRVVTQRHKGHDDYESVSTVINKYDPKYFGTYKSHVSGDIQTGNYSDDRANALKRPTLVFGAIGAVVLAVVGGFYVAKFFRGETIVQSPSVAKVTPSAVNLTASASITQSQSVPRLAPVAPSSVKPVDVIQARLVQLSADAQIRYVGALAMAGHTEGLVEWVEKGGRVLQVLSLDDLRAMGVGVVLGRNIVRLALGDWQAVAMMWSPADPGGGRVPVATQQAIARQGQGMTDQAAIQAVQGAPVTSPSSEPEVLTKRATSIALRS